MKRFFLISFISGLLLFTNCQDDHDSNSEPILTACGVKDPAQNIPWLKDLISKAEEDRINKINRYMGTIYLETFEGKEVFYYEQMVSSCMYCSVYDCDGNNIVFTSGNLSSFKPRKNRIIYTNFPQ